MQVLAGSGPVPSRYRDVLSIERDATRYSSARGSRPLIEMSASMINRDDPRHQQQRKLLSGRFSPPMAEVHGTVGTDDESGRIPR